MHLDVTLAKAVPCWVSSQRQLLNEAALGKKSFQDYVGRSENVAHLLPDEITEAGFWFLLQMMKITTTFHAFQWMAKFISSDVDIVEEYLDFLGEEGEAFSKEKEEHMSFYDAHIMEMIWADEIHFSKVIDTTIAYLIDIVSCCYVADPSKVGGKAKVDVASLSKYKTIGAAMQASTTAEVERLSRSGFSEILSEAQRVTGLDLPSELDSKLRKYVSLRNEIVHKKGAYHRILAGLTRRKKPMLKHVHHQPQDTLEAEYLAAQVVGLFEVAAITSGVSVDATKREIFQRGELG